MLVEMEAQPQVATVRRRRPSAGPRDELWMLLERLDALRATEIFERACARLEDANERQLHPDLLNMLATDVLVAEGEQ